MLPLIRYPLEGYSTRVARLPSPAPSPPRRSMVSFGWWRRGGNLLVSTRERRIRWSSASTPYSVAELLCPLLAPKWRPKTERGRRIYRQSVTVYTCQMTSVNLHGSRRLKCHHTHRTVSSCHTSRQQGIIITRGYHTQVLSQHAFTIRLA